MYYYFLPKDTPKQCLFKVDIIEYEKTPNQSLVPIPLIAEDFSLEYSKSEEVIITKNDVKNLDKKQLIKGLLNLSFTDVSYDFVYDEIQQRKLLKFNEEFLNKILNSFLEKMLKSFFIG